MKLVITTIAACALLSLGAAAQTSFPAPPPELSVSTEYGPSLEIGGGPGMFEEGLDITDDEPVMLMAQAMAPAPAQGGGNAVYMTQGPGGPGGPGPGDHFQMRVGGPHKWWKDSETVKQLQLSDSQASPAAKR